MTSKNSQKTRRFANCGVILASRKFIPPPPSTAEETCTAIAFDTGANRGFGAEESDWLGAEAYVDPLH